MTSFTHYFNHLYGVKIMDPMKVAAIDTMDVITPEEEEAMKALPAINLDDVLESHVELKQHKNPLVIYHGNCADGFSAAWVFYHVGKFIQQTFDFHYGVYNDPPPDVEDRMVYLVDFSYKRAVIKKMLLDNPNTHIVIIDHHKTAIEDLTGLDDELEEEDRIRQMELDGTSGKEYNQRLELVFDMEMSGATLAWKYWESAFQSVGVPRPVLLGHIEDRDLWRFKLPLTREIQANVFSYEYTFANWDKLMLRTSTVLLAEGGVAIERKHHKDVAELVKVCQRFLAFEVPDSIPFHPNIQTTLDGTKRYINVPVASLPYTLTSDAGHLMAKNYLAGQAFAVCYWDTSLHRVFSLRSVEGTGMDVSLIAKQYGGGGHKHAAGFSVTRDHPLARS